MKIINKIKNCALVRDIRNFTMVVISFIKMIIALIKLARYAGLRTLDLCHELYIRSKYYKQKNSGNIAIYKPRENPVKTMFMHIKKLNPIACAACIAVIILTVMYGSANAKAEELQSEIESASVYAANIESATDTVIETTTATETTTAATTTTTEVLITTTTTTETAPAQKAQSDNKVGRTYEVSDNIVKFIQSYEGYYAERYYCESHYPTIGYGHVLSGKNDPLWNAHLTKKEAAELLKKDLNGSYKKELDKFIKDNKLILTQQQYDAMISFAFNCGAKVWYKKAFKFRDTLLSYKDGSKIPASTVRNQMDNWNHGSDGVLPGLTRRRRNEARLFSTGSYDIIADQNDY